MGMDREPVHAARRRKSENVLLRGQRAGEPYRAPRGEGRLASVRAQLLPALPAGGAPRRGDRHFDLPHRIPLRRARGTFTLLKRRVTLTLQTTGARRPPDEAWLSPNKRAMSARRSSAQAGLSNVTPIGTPHSSTPFGMATAQRSRRLAK